MKKTIKLSILATALLGVASSSQAATIAEVESALGGGTGTFIDLQSTPGGFTNGGVTGDWSNWPDPGGAWGFTDDFPSNGDSSNSAVLVNGLGADSSSNPTPEIQVDYTGLLANTTYDLWAVVIQDGNAGAGTFDLGWGTTSGSLATIATAAGGYAGATVIDDEGPINPNRQLAGVLLGQISTNGAGAVTIYYGEGVGTGRTQFDGVLLEVVPEPSSFALLGLGGLFLLRRRRK